MAFSGGVLDIFVLEPFKKVDMVSTNALRSAVLGECSNIAKLFEDKIQPLTFLSRLKSSTFLTNIHL